MPMNAMAHATSGPMGANRAMKPAVSPLTSLYKVSIGRAAFEDVVIGIVFGKFRGMCFEVFRSAARERAGLAAQAALQFAQRLGIRRLVGTRFGATVPHCPVRMSSRGCTAMRVKSATGAARYSAVKPAWRPASSFRGMPVR